MVSATANSPANEPGALEDADVLRRGGKRHLARLRQLGDRSLPGGETTEHVSPRQIGERAEHSIERSWIGRRTGRRGSRTLFNHMVHNMLITLGASTGRPCKILVATKMSPSLRSSLGFFLSNRASRAHATQIDRADPKNWRALRSAPRKRQNLVASGVLTV